MREKCWNRQGAKDAKKCFSLFFPLDFFAPFAPWRLDFFS
jgi:hypothetical protein